MAEQIQIAPRPLVTFALFAYNQEAYIREAIEGAFAQTYEPLEIILSDDCSKDGTFQIMQEMAASYKGPHRVRVRKGERNLGIAQHFNTLVEMSEGTLISAAAGDDISLPQRVERAVACFDRDPDLTFVECALDEFDETGPIHTYSIAKTGRTYSLRDIIDRPTLGLVGAGRTYRKSILMLYPPLAKDCPTEDSTSVLRCLMQGNGLYDPVATVRRRLHSENVSRVGGISAERLQNISHQYLSDIQFAVRNAFQTKEILAEVRQSLAAHIDKRIFRQLRAEGKNIFAAVAKTVVMASNRTGSILNFLRASANGLKK